jgi:hypothetical protein
MTCRNNSIKSRKAQVAWTYLCLCLLLGVSLGHAVDSTTALSSYKDLQSNFESYRHESSISHPEPVSIASSGGIRSSLFGSMPSSDPVDEKIVMNVANSKEQVQDIVAMNTVKQRDIVYDDVQRGDWENQNLSNSMDIEVSGNGMSEKNGLAGIHSDDDLGNAIEERVDAATASGMNKAVRDNAGSARTQGNSLNIDVHGITVTATNTVPGGSAIATSNIKIEPVQIIINPSEVSEKLK